MNNVSKILIAGVSVLLAGGCSHYQDDMSALEGKMKKTDVASVNPLAPQDIAPAAGAPARNDALAREYYDMARYENDKAYDYKAAKLFTGKAMMAANGKYTAPSRIGNYDIPADRIPELNEARQKLIQAMKEQNTPENAATLAKAQCRFDCWLDRAEEASNEKHYESCKQEFEQAMATLTMPAAGAATAASVTHIDFAPNAPAIESASAPSINQIAAFLTSPQGAGYTVVVTAFTDMAAPSEANRVLASQRALSVRSELINRGVNAAVIKPQTAPIPQTAAVIPVAGGPAADIVVMNDKVQINLVAPAVSAAPSTVTQ